MKRWLTTGLLAGTLAAFGAAPGSAQEIDLMDVGEMAPDIEFVGASADGVMEGTRRLSEYRGETVVLAFFFRARTRG
jgi:peroxiredoxin Q/BCP